jgi:hypothetical protein
MENNEKLVCMKRLKTLCDSRKRDIDYGFGIALTLVVVSYFFAQTNPATSNAVLIYAVLFLVIGVWYHIRRNNGAKFDLLARVEMIEHELNMPQTFLSDETTWTEPDCFKQVRLQRRQQPAQ